MSPSSDKRLSVSHEGATRMRAVAERARKYRWGKRAEAVRAKKGVSEAGEARMEGTAG